MTADNPWNIENRLDAIVIIQGANEMLQDMIASADFMVAVPKDHFEYRFALATQTWYAMHMVTLMKRNYVKNDFYSMISAAMFLRALIETTANINYFSRFKNDAALANKFLKTAKTSWNNLMAIRDGLPLRNCNWTNLSVASRIKLLNDDSKVDHYCVYKYLSSFIHSDAGYVGGMFHLEGDPYRRFYASRTNLCLHSIIASLEKAGVMDNGMQLYLDALEKFVKDENRKLRKAS